MKTILVTGANRGIGLEICRQLGELGHHVIMGSRDYEKGVEASRSLGGDVVVKQLDITDEESMLRLYEFLDSEKGRLDVLINNAALGASFHKEGEPALKKFRSYLEKHIPGIDRLNQAIAQALRSANVLDKRESASNVSMWKVKYIMDTNLYGAWRMMQVFLPLLERSNGGRIINISSGMGELSSLDGEYPAYRISKASLNALTIMFSEELKPKGIPVNAMCPGWVRTDMGGPNAPRSVEKGAETAVWLATEEFIPTGKFFRDRTEIAW